MDWLGLLMDVADEDSDWGQRRGRPHEPPITLDLRDELCARCRKPMRYTNPGVDGVPTCPSCRAALDRPQPQGACPGDGQPLEAQRVSNVAIDRCPSCGGVWLDEGELELIITAAAQAAKRGPEAAADLLATVLVGLPRRRTSGNVADELL
jgi:hypothetical protein